jgi:hypothetical protein
MDRGGARLNQDSIGGRRCGNWGGLRRRAIPPRHECQGLPRNWMNANHLIIGLGGTGGKIIRAFRKTIFQEFRKIDPPNVRLSYLYVDSSDELMRLDDPSWKVLGQSVQIPPTSQLLIKSSNLASILEDLPSYPGIQPWIGDKTIWRDILNSIIGDAIGGQKRRLGRFLFASHADEFCHRLTHLVNEIQKGGQQDVTFHVCCGLAGGTGSGTLIDCVSQIRKNYPNTLQYRIVLYTLLPEEHPKPNWNTGNYHANGYAALLELNALSVGKFYPCDIAGDGRKLEELKTPFNGCYVFTNFNENGLAVDISEDIPNILADFLYQKIVTVRNINWESLGRAENAENGDGNPETLPGSNDPVRSKRFLTFGVKRLSVPESEISEYIAFQFARQAALQLRYNNWSETDGFLADPRNLDMVSYVSSPEQLERWMLSDEHFILSSPILESDGVGSKWQPVSRYWMNVTTNLKEYVQGKETADKWLDRLKSLLDARFQEQYRGQGVKAFYETVNQSTRERAREIRQKLERELFSDWVNGTKSAYEISSLLGALIPHLKARFDRIEEEITKLKPQEEELAKRLAEQQKEWAKVGVISDMFGKRKRLFDAASTVLQDLYTVRTKIEGWQFAKKFLPAITEEIVLLKADVDKAASMIAESIKAFEDQIAVRCSDQGAMIDLRKQVIRFYDPELVKNVTKRLIKDQKEATTQTQRVRTAIAEMLGEKLDFKTLNERISKTVFLDTLERQCMENAKIAHNNLVHTESDRLIGVSIIEKLKERYADRQSLRLYLDNVVKAAGNYLLFNSDEKRRVGPGINPTAQIAVSNFTVILPKAPEMEDYIKVLKEVFFECIRNPSKEFIENDTRLNEIILVSITNLFPLRIVQHVSFLKSKYLERINGSDSKRARMELHIEGDGQTLPSLFVPTRTELEERLAPLLLLGMVLKEKEEDGTEREMLQKIETETGAMQLGFMQKDEYGFDQPVYLGGENFSETLSNIREEAGILLEQKVEALLKSPELKLEPKRKEVESEIVKKVNSLRGTIKPTDPKSRKLADWGKLAIKKVRGEL